jgi:hypothetical protein
MNKVIHISVSTYGEAVEPLPLAFVAFHARRYEDILQTVAGRHDDQFFFMMDSERDLRHVTGCDIEELPTIAAFRHGRIFDSITALSEDALDAFVNRVAARAA